MIDSHCHLNFKKLSDNFENIIIKSAIMLYPIIPTSSKKILNIFNYNMDNNKFENLTKLINQNIKINNPEPIFPRILND